MPAFKVSFEFLYMLLIVFNVSAATFILVSTEFIILFAVSTADNVLS